MVCMPMEIYRPSKSVPVSVTTRKNDNGVGVCADVKGRLKSSTVFDNDKTFFTFFFFCDTKSQHQNVITIVMTVWW